MKPSIYQLSHKIKFKTFKLLQEKMVKDSGPSPKEGDRILWEMLRDKQIYCWFDPLVQGDMGVGLTLPKRKVIIISSPKT